MNKRYQPLFEKEFELGEVPGFKVPDTEIGLKKMVSLIKNNANISFKQGDEPMGQLKDTAGDVDKVIAAIAYRWPEAIKQITTDYDSGVMDITIDGGKVTIKSENGEVLIDNESLGSGAMKGTKLRGED